MAGISSSIPCPRRRAGAGRRSWRRLRLLRAGGNLAGAGGKLVRGPVRPPHRGDDRRHPGGGCLDDQFHGGLDHHALCRRDCRRHRRGRGLWHLCRQCREMVHRTARLGRRLHRRGLRRGHGDHRGADSIYHRLAWLSGRLPVVRPGAGHHHPGGVAIPARPGARPQADGPGSQSPDHPQLCADGSAEHAALLAALSDVRHGRLGRLDRHRPVRLHRGGSRAWPNRR